MMNITTSNLQSITTKYHGPTNTKGSRISATGSGGVRFYTEYDHALDAEDNHKAACRAFVERMGWPGASWRGGATDTGYVFVCLNEVFE